MKTNKLLFYSRCFLMLLAVTGTTIELAKYGLGMLLYYTVQSNLLVSLFTLYMVVSMWQKKDLQDKTFLRVKAAVTMSILITCVVYHLLLAPLAKDFWRLENLLCHYIVPLYFLMDTLLVDNRRRYRWFDPLWWTSLPLFYMVFGLANGYVFQLPVPKAKDTPFPYFFLNAPKHGWGYVLTYAAVIFTAYLVVGYLLFAVKSIRTPSAVRKQV